MNTSLRLLQESPIKIKISSIKTKDDNLYIGQRNNENTYVLLVHKSSEQNLHFSFEFQKLAEIKKNRNLRQYQEMFSDTEYNKYLFQYWEGKTIAERIEMMKSQLQSFPLETIKTYTFKLIQALYELHKMGLMGRCFNSQNILEYREDQNIQIILMNFGFFSDLNNQEFSLLPPEIYLQKTYDLKLDIWLLGAFMYHLVKLNPISNSKPYGSIVKKSANYAEGFGAYIETKSQSQRYSVEVTTLIERMLTYDKENRISFNQLLKDNFWSGLENLQEMQAYYDQNEGRLNEALRLTIQKREADFLDQSNGGLINTNTLQAPDRVNGLVDLISTRPIPHYQFTAQAQNSQCEDSSLRFLYRYPNYEQSPYSAYWELIYLDQFAFLLLQETVQNFQQLLQQSGIHELAKYILKKMELLLIKDLLSKLKQAINPWRQYSNADWNKFKLTPELRNLEETLINYSCKTQRELKELFPKICNFRTDNRLDSQIQQSLQKDADDSFEYTETSEIFKKHGYRQFTILAYNQIKAQLQIVQDEQKTLLLRLAFQIILSHIINKAFQKENLQLMYPVISEFKKRDSNNQHNQVQITAQDVFKFIYKSFNNEKNKQISYIIDRYFQHR